MTISHGNLKRLPRQAVSALSVATVILTAAAPTTLHARGYKKHHTLYRAGGVTYPALAPVGASVSGAYELAKMTACEGRPNPQGIRSTGNTVFERLRRGVHGSKIHAVLNQTDKYGNRAYVLNCSNPVTAMHLAQARQMIAAGGAPEQPHCTEFRTQGTRGAVGIPIAGNVFKNCGGRGRGALVASRQTPAYASQPVAAQPALGYGQPVRARNVRYAANPPQPASPDPGDNLLRAFGINPND